MTLDNENFKTPGQLIQYLLKEKNWSQRVLAVVLGVDETGLNRLVSDKRPVDANMALALSELLDVPAERFLELQKSYDLAKARITNIPDPDRAIRAKLFGDLPISAMIKRGWISAESIRDVKKVESELTKFFGVESSRDIEILPHAAKKTEVNADVTPAQLAWLYQVRTIASEMLAAKYTKKSALNAIKKLESLLKAPEEIRHVPRILVESGIRFLIVESLPSAKIDGVCFWLNDNSPVIAMTIRYDRIDNFWFVLRHELEHVLNQHGKQAVMLDIDLVGERSGEGEAVEDEERIANMAAADFCVPKSKMDGFIARKAPFFAERDLLGFAQTLNVHPGLVAGQLSHRTGRHDRFKKYLVSVRDKIIPSAIVDGWGNPYPID